jgi:protein-L-isoaspartate(D-aspartate) O-methyltransferase
MIAETRKIRLIMELRQGGVTDADVLSAIERVPREAFVPDIFKDRAYDNAPLPIGEGQTISQPLIVGLMTQALELSKRHKVLEIGTGSGYQTAILARLCRRVYTIERIRPLYDGAMAVLQDLQVRNVTGKVGDGSRGWPEQAPFDRIIVTAAAPVYPQVLADQLAEGGILVVPVERGLDDQELLKIRRTPDGFSEEDLAPVRFVPLISDRAGKGGARG